MKGKVEIFITEHNIYFPLTNVHNNNHELHNLQRFSARDRNILIFNCLLKHLFKHSIFNIIYLRDLRFF